MSQNNSDNAALYTAQHTSNEQQLKIAHLYSQLDHLKNKLKEIADVPMIEGATLLTISALIQYKVEQAIKIIDD
jgi:dihydroxyacetone kinase DhaKLM complex PTS-EIIA-like component DhaM